MFRYPILLLSLLMLGLSFSSPKNHWLIDISVFGYAIQGDAYNWLFIIGLLSFVPVLLANIILCFLDTIQLIKTKKPIHMVNLVFFSLIPFIALYRFNYWVMNDIF